MKKDSVLLGIIGLLVGLIVGFMFANNVNQRGGVTAPVAATQQNQALPPDHPPVNSSIDHGAAPDMAMMQVALKLAKDQPDNFDAQRKVAESYYEAQRFDEAVEFLKRANQLRPDDYETIVQLGNVNYDASHFEEAEHWYTLALEKKPDDVNVRTDLGLTFMLRNPANLDRAIAEFRKSLGHDSTHVKTLQNLTVAFTSKGDAAEARASLAKLEAISPNNPALPTLRSDLEKLGSPTVKN